MKVHTNKECVQFMYPIFIFIIYIMFENLFILESELQMTDCDLAVIKKTFLFNIISIRFKYQNIDNYPIF